MSVITIVKKCRISRKLSGKHNKKVNWAYYEYFDVILFGKFATKMRFDRNMKGSGNKPSFGAFQQLAKQTKTKVADFCISFLRAF